MRLTILGNNGPYPCGGGACSGYLLESDSGNTAILIDCGTGVLANLMGMDALDRLDAVVLSHLHYDHMSDLLPMQYAIQFHPRKHPLPVYAPRTPEPVRALLEGAPCYDLWDCQDATVGEMKIAFNPARHPVETYAVAVTCDGARFVFTGDSNTDALLELFCEGADLLLADAGLSAEDWKPTAPHFSTALCGQLAKNTRARRLLLTHFNPKYDPDALLNEARRDFPAARAAWVGEVFYI